MIEEVGAVAELSDENAEAEEVSQNSLSNNGKKKLFRDIDDAWLGGVCSGIGRYFDVNPLWIRLVFLISLVPGGTGVVIYLMLWFLIPAAKNTSQKLAMQGQPINIETISQAVKDRVESVGDMSGARRFVRSAIVGSYQLARRLIGIFFITAPWAIIILLSIGVGFSIFNWDASYGHALIQETGATLPLIVGALAALYIAIVIPLIFVYLLGLRLMNRIITLPCVVGFGLFGVWLVSVITLGITSSTIASRVVEYQATAPAYQTSTATLELPPFNSVKTNDVTIFFKKGATQSVVVEGRVSELQQIAATVGDGVLDVSKLPTNDTTCLFCGSDDPVMIITSPDITALDSTDSTIVFDDYSAEKLAITSTSSYLRGSLLVDTLTLKTRDGSFYGRVNVDELSLDSIDSYYDLSGKANKMTLSVEDTSLALAAFIANEAIISAVDSSGEIFVEGNLDYVRAIDSEVINVAVDGGGDNLELLE